MNDLDSQSKARISALVDGAMRQDELASEVSHMLTNPCARATWHTYQIVGDVLRSADLAPSADEADFWARLSEKIAREPGRPSAQGGGNAIQESPCIDSSRFEIPSSSANATAWRWKALAGVAGTAMLGVMGFGLWAQTQHSTTAQLAIHLAAPAADVNAPVTLVQSSNGAMFRNPELDELLVAHRQLGGHSALQLPAGFLRNATYQGPAQ